MVIKNIFSKKFFIYCLCLIISISLLYFAAKFINTRIRINQVKTAYSLLNSAYAEAAATENFQWKKETMTTEVFAPKFLKHLSVKKDCGLSTKEACFPRRAHFLRTLGSQDYSPLTGFHKTELNNGMSIAFIVLSPDCSYVRGRCATIVIDVNGTKHGPNQLGNDLFDFAIFKNELRPYEAEYVHRDRCLEGNGQGCADYILKFNSMNYNKHFKNEEK